MRYVEPLFRPPSEADSFILQATLGCSWNACTYCAMYRDKPYRVRPLGEILEDIAQAGAHFPEEVRHVFVADGDPLGMELGRWEPILRALKAAFPTDAKTATTSATDGADLGRCAGLIADVFDLQGQPSHVGTATIRGTDVLVIEFPASATTTGERRPLITAVEPVGCAPVVTFVR